MIGHGGGTAGLRRRTGPARWSTAERGGGGARVWVGCRRKMGCMGQPGECLKGDARPRRAGLREGRGEIFGGDCGEALCALGKEALTCGATASARGERTGVRGPGGSEGEREVRRAAARG